MRAVGLCNTLGRTATIFTPFLVVFLFGKHGVKGVVILMIGSLVVQILVIHFYGIESRMGRLEEIQ
jgi:putative MFS transporter